MRYVYTRVGRGVGRVREPQVVKGLKRAYRQEISVSGVGLQHGV